MPITSYPGWVDKLRQGGSHGEADENRNGEDRRVAGHRFFRTPRRRGETPPEVLALRRRQRHAGRTVARSFPHAAHGRGFSRKA